MARHSYDEVVAATTPATNWSKFAVHPVADRLLWLLANRTTLHPNTVTLVALAFGGASAGFYLRGDAFGMLIGAGLFYVSFALDTIDGALARLTDQRSAFGAWLDTIGDFVRSMVIAPAFAIGVFRETGDIRALYAGFAVTGIGLLYYYLAEVTGKVAGERPARMAENAAARVRWIKALGLVPSPFGLADFEAVYLIVFPLLGHPLAGMVVASVAGALTRMVSATVVLSRLRERASSR